MQAAQAKRDRLTTEDLSQIRDQDQLIDRVSDRYSLPRAQAQTDVVTWVSLNHPEKRLQSHNNCAMS